MTMFAINRRQLYKIARRRGSVISFRGNAYQTGDMAVKSPREIYNDLSQYIIGQEKAKRTLSVAVFNHFTRIAPPSNPPVYEATKHEPIPSSSISSSSGSSLPTNKSKSRSSRTEELSDPSLPVTGSEGDITKLTGAEEGADPTLTHDLLNRSREGQWTRDGGYFSSLKPVGDTPLLSKALRQRKTLAGKDKSGETSKATGSFVEDPRAQDAKGKGKAREEVLLEKSNVLMIGPTGTGKTLMAKTLAKILDVPFASCDATSYTQAGYVGEDVENCVLRLLQAAEYDVNRTEIGIIHIDEIDKLARRGGSDFGSWGGGRDVGGEGVQQALLRLLEGTNVTLSAKPPPIASTSSSPSSTSSTASTTGPTISPSGGAKAEAGSSTGAGSGYEPPNWNPNDPMNRLHGSNSQGKKGVREGLPGFSGGGGGGGGGKGETFVVDTSNILFILSGAFVGLESIVQRRIGKGSIGFGAPLPKPPSEDGVQDTTPLKVQTPDLQTYGLIPEFLGRLPIISTLHPLSNDDLIRILMEPKNALIKQYTTIFERYGSELRFTNKALKAIADVGLKRGGGARGLRGVLEEILGDSMFEVPGSSVRYCLITEGTVQGTSPARYFSRGQKHIFEQDLEDENRPDEGLSGARIEEVDSEIEEEGMRATG